MLVTCWLLVAFVVFLLFVRIVSCLLCVFLLLALCLFTVCVVFDGRLFCVCLLCSVRSHLACLFFASGAFGVRSDCLLIELCFIIGCWFVCCRLLVVRLCVCVMIEVCLRCV